MALAHSPKIVTNNLLMALDAANAKSYSGSGTAWNDLSGNGLNGTLLSSPTFSLDGQGCFTFNPNNSQRCTVSSADVLSKTAYTKMLFFKCNDFNFSNNLISYASEHNLWLANGPRIRGGHARVGTDIVISNASIVLNQWYCTACVFSSTSGWALYVNGVLDATSTNTVAFAGTGGINIASYGSANLFSGSIAFPMVYNRALTTAEIKQNFDALRGRFGI